MKRLAFAVALVLGLALVGCQKAPEKAADNATAAKPAAEEVTIVNGFDGGGFPPYAFVDKEGKTVGFDVEAIEWIGKKMGFKVKHQPVEWSAIIPALEAKKIDIICSGMSATAERAERVAFSDPYYKVTQVLVVKGDNKATLQQMLSTGKKIGVQRGTVTAKYLEELSKKPGMKFTLVQYDSSDLAMQDLPVGRIAGSGMDNTIAKEVLKKDKNAKVVGTFDAPAENYGYAMRKDDVELQKKVNEGLKLLMADPYWQELKKKYDID
ncbi:MAG: ABC transporter substrate-binding protein [Humidesulfovibrio sp.]|nr:ABC transporter substrate-binding protein [Humidesulfovibrio sp.]